MGALLQPRPSEVRTGTRKGPAREETAPKLDQYGRDPESLPEKLRAQTDYAADTGYGPMYHAAVVDLPRLSSGAVCYAFVLVVNALSYGRPRFAKDPRHVWTLPLSAAELAEYCRANVRDVQRQLAELPERGLIAVKQIKQGGAVKYSISLLYSKWRELEDYAVWKRRQVVAIDAAGEEGEETEDEAAPEITKGAVPLFKRPQSVRPGRATRLVPIKVGVKGFRCVNKNSSVDLSFEGVIESGELVVSATAKTGEVVAKGEEKGNAARHGCRDIPASEGSGQKRKLGESPKHPRSAEIISLFDPLLMRWGASLLVGDPKALQKACAELGDIPRDFLSHFLLNPKGRGSRAISGCLAVASIVKDARLLWEKQDKTAREFEAVTAGKQGEIESRQRRQNIENAKKILASDSSYWTDEDREFARETLAESEREA